MVIILEGEIGVSVGAREAGTRGGGRYNGVDMWAVTGDFRANVIGVSFSGKPE